MRIRRIAATGTVSLAMVMASGGVTKASTQPPPPPQMTVNFVSAKLVARGTSVNVTLTVTCDDLSGQGDGYEPNPDHSDGHAGGMIQVQLAQASGKTLTNGNGFMFFQPNGPAGPNDSSQFCNGTSRSITMSVQPFGSTPFKSGTASIQAGGLECGDFVQNFNNQGPPSGNCDNQDQYDPNANTGDPGAFGNLPQTTIKVASH